MGLDQYIYRLSKVGKDTIKKLNGMHKDDIDYHDYMVVSKETIDKYPNSYSDILDILRPIQVKNTFIDGEKTVDSYICKRKEVYYMRKEYEVQDSIYELYDGVIDNCGYHHMTEDMIDVVNECAGKKVLDTQANNLYYHEWY